VLTDARSAAEELARWLGGVGAVPAEYGGAYGGPIEELPAHQQLLDHVAALA
jgi:hypothetical protein